MVIMGQLLVYNTLFTFEQGKLYVNDVRLLFFLLFLSLFFILFCCILLFCSGFVHLSSLLFVCYCHCFLLWWLFFVVIIVVYGLFIFVTWSC